MALPNGVTRGLYMVHGQYPRFRAIEEQGEDAALRVVAEKIQQQLSLKLRLPRAGAQLVYMSGRRPRRSEVLTAGAHGAAIRIIRGGGFVILNGRRHKVDAGDWVYVRPQRRYQLEDGVVVGDTLHAVYANLVHI